MSLLTLEAKLERQEPTTPWGFRMQGGKDFSSPLTIARVTPKSLADKCGLMQGDIILKIGNKSSDTLKHKDAQDAIVSYGNKLDLLLQRGGAPTYQTFSTPTISSYQSPASNQGQGTSTYNAAPKPFGASVPSNPAPAPYKTSAEINLSQQTQNLNIGSSSPASYSKYADIDDKPNQSTQSRSFKFLQDTLASGQGPPPPPPQSSQAPPPWARSSDTEEDVPKYDAQGKRVYRPSETFKLIQEQENVAEKPKDEPVAPLQTRTIKILEKQLEGEQHAPPPPAPVQPRPPPAAPKPGVWTPGQPSGGAPAAKPFVPSVAPPAPAPAALRTAPPKPSGVCAMRGKIGDAVIKSDATRIPICASCGNSIRLAKLT